MSSPSRSPQFTKLHKVLKKHYQPVSVSAERPVLEHLVFACLLENAPYDLAEEAFAKILEEYFDWNEIRVSSVRELTETLARLPDPPAAAGRLKRVLQHVFEASYSFDLESLRKKNLGPASDAIKKVDGATSFGVSYVIQSALGGHSIPLDSGTLEVLRILAIATDKEVEKGAIAGLERAIPKSKGVEFGSLLHQFGADFTANPFAADLRSKMSEVDPEAKKRWPKRRVGKKAAQEPEPEAAKEKKQTVKKKSPKAADEETKPRSTKRTAKTDSSKKNAAKKTTKKTASVKHKKTTAKTKSSGASASKKKKKAAKGLSRRKPR